MYFASSTRHHRRTPTQAEMNWSMLPGNILLSICDLLAPRQNGRLRLVCKTWKQQINGSLKSLVTNSVCPSPVPISKLPCLFPNLTDLDLSCQKWGFGRSMHPVQCAQLSNLGTLRNLRNLRLMNWASLTPHGMECLLCLESLESLDLTNCHSITDRFLQSFNRASTMKFKLRNLWLNGCERITDEGISHISNLKELVELRLAQVGGIVGKTLTQLSSKLEVLDLSYCENLSDESVRCMLRRSDGFLSNLSYLDLSGCLNIQSTTLTSLYFFTQLTRLKLSGMPRLMDITPWTQLAKLKVLDISFASGLIMHQALVVIAQMTQLRSLRLDGCPLLRGGGGNLKPEVLKDLRNLRCLDLGRWSNLQFGLDVTDVLENLEVLNLSDGGGCVHHYSRNNYFKNAAKLKVLGLSGYSFLPMNVIRGLSTVSSLEILNLSNLGNLNDRMVQEISKLTSLTYLDLSQNGVHCKVSMYGARYLRSLSLLRNLKISGWAETSATGFLVLRHLKNLTSLDVSNCLKLTDKGIKVLSSASSKSLVELSIVNCFQVTCEGLRNLRKCVALETLFLSHHIKGDVKSEIPRVGNIQFISPIDCYFDNGGGNRNNQTAYFQSLLDTLSKEEAQVSTIRRF